MQSDLTGDPGIPQNPNNYLFSVDSGTFFQALFIFIVVFVIIFYTIKYKAWDR